MTHWLGLNRRGFNKWRKVSVHPIGRQSLGYVWLEVALSWDWIRGGARVENPFCFVVFAYSGRAEKSVTKYVTCPDWNTKQIHPQTVEDGPWKCQQLVNWMALGIHCHILLRFNDKVIRQLWVHYHHSSAFRSELGGECLWIDAPGHAPINWRYKSRRVGTNGGEGGQ